MHRQDPPYPTGIVSVRPVRQGYRYCQEAACQHQATGLIRMTEAQPRAWSLFWLGPPYPNHPGKSDHGCVYRWRVQVGPLEIRRWGP